MTGLLAALAFLQPWWLVALAGLPILYWLLRVTPPAPRRTRFPAIRLLLALQPKEETPAQTPLWLLLLRLAIALLIILALAHPLLNPGARLAGPGPMLLVVDDGWGSARQWPARQAAIADLIDRAEREERPVMLLSTAPSLTGEAPRASRLMRATEARTLATAIEPKPWPTDRGASLAALENTGLSGQASVVYLSDGLNDDKVTALVERLQRIGPVEFFADANTDLARLLLPPTADASGLTVTAARADGAGAVAGFVRASGEDGRLLAREELKWAEGQKTASARIALPTELRNRVARLEIDGEASSGSAVLIDERWRRRPVGLVSGSTIEKSQPLLAETYYLERALSPFSQVRNGDVGELLARELAVIILADVGRLPDGDRTPLDQWMRRGGVVVRFAGPRMAESADELVPVPLRAGGGRAFGGAMTWGEPVGLAAFDANGAFANLTVPDDVRVTRQVLAEPSLDLSSRTWARLSDGTPLVTADKRGDGWLVLIHTTANPDWSTLALSGLFVEMLQRLVALSQGVAAEAAEGVLPPVSSLDGFGRLQAPLPAAIAVAAAELTRTPVSPRHPPGFYGTDAARRAINLSAQVAAPAPIAALPDGVARRQYAGGRAVDFKPFLLTAALTLLLVDLVVSLLLRGLWPRWRARATTAMLFLLIAALPAHAQLQRPGSPQARPAPTTQQGIDTEAALTATLSTRFAFVRTGNQEVDEIARAGLAGLGFVLSRRTAVDPGAPIDLDIERDEMAFYPIVYWPIVPEAPRPSAAALSRVDHYLRRGGLIIFDTRDSDTAPPGAMSPAGVRLRDILRQLNLAPLTPVPATHVLTKAFYLISEFPGRWNGGQVWVEQSDDRVNDGVSSVIIGGHDWAASWALDSAGRPLYAAVPGGETQREYAVRFGVNAVMYALTGNYKADQVHIDAIMERMRR